MARGELDTFSNRLESSQNDSGFLRNYRELAGSGLVLYSIDAFAGGQLVYAPSTEISEFEQAVNPIITKPLWTNLLLPLIVLGLFLFFNSQRGK